MARFHEIAQELFGYLQSEFGYKVVGAEKTDSGGHVTYVNSNAGVGIKVVYEIPCAFVFVFIYRLVDGELRENRLPIDVDTDVTCFDFNDYLEPALKMKPAYEYGGETRYSDSKFGLRNYTEESASRLRTYGERILNGDLSMFLAMASVIKKRAQDLK